MHDPATTKTGGAAIINVKLYNTDKATPSPMRWWRVNSDGFSLVTVLFSLMILMSLMASISSAYLKPQLILRGTTKIIQTTSIEQAGLARISLLAGEAMLTKSGSQKTGIPKLDGTPFTLDVDGTILTYHLYDQEGLIDLNLAAPKLLRLYFKRLELPDIFTDSFLEDREVRPEQSLLRFQTVIGEHAMAKLATVGSNQSRLSYRTTPMELLVFLAGNSGKRGDLIAKIGRQNFVSGRVEVVVLR